MLIVSLLLLSYTIKTDCFNVFFNYIQEQMRVQDLEQVLV